MLIGFLMAAVLVGMVVWLLFWALTFAVCPADRLETSVTFPTGPPTGLEVRLIGGPWDGYDVVPPSGMMYFDLRGGRYTASRAGWVWQKGVGAYGDKD